MKKIIVTLLLVAALFGSSAAFAGAKDPFKVHKGPFGPDIEGFQLGKTFKDLGEIYDLVLPLVKETENKMDANINILHDVQVVGNIRWRIHWNKEEKYFDFFEEPQGVGKLFAEPKSIKEREERKKWGLDEYLKVALSVPNWVLNIGVSDISASFVLSDGVFKLVCFEKRRIAPNGSNNNEKIALALIDTYGLEDNFQESQSSESALFYKDPSSGFGVYINRDALFFALADDKTCYPLLWNISFVNDVIDGSNFVFMMQMGITHFSDWEYGDGGKIIW
jgi:hypothetical protein